MKVPHPIPYQGSKRNLAKEILRYFPKEIGTLHEPFAGSAAMTLATACLNLTHHFWLNDLNKPLIDLWDNIINHPERLIKQYEKLWLEQLENPLAFYNLVRDQFNLTGRPDYFLFLLVRCVKASVRYNANGEFNQSPDKRRKGTSPKTMRNQILRVSHLLKSRTTLTSKNYRDVVCEATTDDLIYMDPPYQGVCGDRDTRYLSNIQFCEFVEVLDYLNSRDIKYIVSYDGYTGNKTHGKMLPENLGLARIELHAGRSSQATLLGRNDITVESLYLSPALVETLSHTSYIQRYSKQEQLYFLESSK